MFERFEGEVKWFSNERGYGFICPIVSGGKIDENTEYFVHFSSINISGYKTLTAGQMVLFELTKTDKGTQATNVEVIK